MTDDSFFLTCDRLSQSVDATQYERLRWAKTEGPMLARLVELAHGAIADRPEFELTEEGATGDIRRFVLKIHGHRVIGLVIWLDQDHRACLTVENIARGRYQVMAGDPVSADYALVDEAWMAATLQVLFARIQL